MEKPVWSDRGFSQVSLNTAGSLQPRSDDREHTLCFCKMQQRSLHTRAKEVSRPKTRDTNGAVVHLEKCNVKIFTAVLVANDREGQEPAEGSTTQECYKCQLYDWLYYV